MKSWDFPSMVNKSTPIEKRVFWSCTYSINNLWFGARIVYEMILPCPVFSVNRSSTICKIFEGKSKQIEPALEKCEQVWRTFRVKHEVSTNSRGVGKRKRGMEWKPPMYRHKYGTKQLQGDYALFKQTVTALKTGIHFQIKLFSCLLPSNRRYVLGHWGVMHIE